MWEDKDGNDYIDYFKSKSDSYKRIDFLTYEGRHNTDPNPILIDFLNHGDFNEDHYLGKFDEFGVACECEGFNGIRCLMVFTESASWKESDLQKKFSKIALLTDCAARC